MVVFGYNHLSGNDCRSSHAATSNNGPVFGARVVRGMTSHRLVSLNYVFARYQVARLSTLH